MVNVNLANINDATIPEGDIIKIEVGGIILWEYSIKNCIPTSIDTDGGIYNGVGYILGQRLSSSGALSAQLSTVTSGYIPAKRGDIIRLIGANWFPASGTYNYLAAYDSSFQLLGSLNINTGDEQNYRSVLRGEMGSINNSGRTTPTVSNGVTIFDQIVLPANTAYIRISGRYTENSPGERMVVTVNQNILPNMIKPPYENCENFVPVSTEANGSIYQGVGYINGYRLSSGGTLKAQTNTTTTGFIPATQNDIIQMSGVTWEKPGGSNYNYLTFYDINFNQLQTMNVVGTVDTNFSNIGNGKIVNTNKTKHSVVKDANGIYTFNLTYQSGASYAYIRLSATGSGENMIVMINKSGQ